jgi:hypothetical protein
MSRMNPVIVIASLALATACHAESPLAVGVGQSSEPDARKAGAAAALAAKTALGATPAKLVVVFAARRQLDTNLVAGVASHFDKTIITGCEGYSPLTPVSNFADQGHSIKSGIAVMALGGAATIRVVSADVGDIKGNRKQAFLDNGRTLGAALKSSLATAPQGRVILTFGNQHVGDNQGFVDGLREAAGSPTIVVGAAAGGPDAREIIRGEVVRGHNVAILLAGDFKVGTGLADGKQDLVGVTRNALTKALETAEGTPVLGLVFDCGGRRGELIKQGILAAEHQAIQKLLGKAPFFGFYGGGEIGTAAAGEAPRGVGFSVAAAVISVR